MRFRTEIRDGGDEEIVIVCHGRSEKIKRLERIIENALGSDAEMILELGDVEYYVKKSDVLFFETYNGRVAAHTREKMFSSGSTLAFLESDLPESFIRVSKSCIVNVAQICAVSSGITGNGEVLFKDSDKKAYVSRGYYKALKERIYRLRNIT